MIKDTEHCRIYVDDSYAVRAAIIVFFGTLLLAAGFNHTSATPTIEEEAKQAIREKNDDLRGQGFSGIPADWIPSPLPTKNRDDAYFQFFKGPPFPEYGIWWTRETGAHEVHGGILAKWREIGFESSGSGFPLSDETRIQFCADKRVPGQPCHHDVYSEFQNIYIWADRRSIDVVGKNDVHSGVGFIQIDKRLTSMRERGFPGNDVDTKYTVEPVGVQVFFDINGEGRPMFGIFWSPRTGTHIVRGAIFQEYLYGLLAEKHLGYPKTEQLELPNGVRYNEFENGNFLVWTSETGAIPARSLNLKEYRVVFENVFSHNSHDDWGCGVWDMALWINGVPEKEPWGAWDWILLNGECVDQHELVELFSETGRPDVTLTVPQDIIQGLEGRKYGIHIFVDGLERDCISDDAPSPFEPESGNVLYGCLNPDDALGIVDVTADPIRDRVIGVDLRIGSTYNKGAADRGLEAGDSTGDYEFTLCISDLSPGSCELEG